MKRRQQEGVEEGVATFAAATMARAIPVLPEVGSISIVLPGLMSPRFSAWGCATFREHSVHCESGLL